MSFRAIRVVALCGAAGLMFSVSSVTYAQTEGRVSAGAASGDIVVTARRVSERLQDVPLSITALTGDALEDAAVTEIRQLNAIAPSLVLKEHSNNAQGVLITMRGQSQAGIQLTLDSSVGVYIDGINIPRASSLRSAMLDLERIEVLHGPQGTLYGRNTTGGAISIITKSPEPTFGGYVKASYGNYDAGNLVGVLNIPLSQNVATRFVAQRGFRDGYGKNLIGTELNDEDSLYLRGKIRGEWGDFSAQLSANYARFKQHGAAGYISGVVPGYNLAVNAIAYELGLPLDPSPAPSALLVGRPSTPEALQTAVDELASYIRGGSTGRSIHDNDSIIDSFSNYHEEAVSLDLQYQINENLKIRSLSGFKHHNRKNIGDYGPIPYKILEGHFVEVVDYYSEEVQLLGEFGRFNFVLGGFMSHESGYESSPGDTLPNVLVASKASYQGDVTNKNLSVFAQANYDITDRLTFTGGLRYSQEKRQLVSYNHSGLDGPFTGNCFIPTELLDKPGICKGTINRTDSDPSWLASLSYKFTDDIMAYAKFARGFRAGGHNLRGANTVQTFATFGPETVTEYEVGFKAGLLDRKLQLNVAAYQDDYKNMQRTIVVLIPGGGTSSIVTNAASATIKGIDFEATLRPVEGLTLGAVVGYLDAGYDEFVDFTGDRSTELWPAPDWTYSFSADYRVPVSFGKVSMHLDYQGQSRQNLYPAGRFRNDTIQEAYALLNGRLALEMDDGWSVALWGRNLTDKAYAQGGQNLDALGFNMKFAGSPRTYGFELRKDF